VEGSEDKKNYRVCLVASDLIRRKHLSAATGGLGSGNESFRQSDIENTAYSTDQNFTTDGITALQQEIQQRDFVNRPNKITSATGRNIFYPFHSNYCSPPVDGNERKMNGER
jgi:hypothetical protein